MKKAHLVALAVMLAMLAAGPAQAAPPARPLHVPGDCTVTNTNDSGPGSLRQCILGLQPGATITFNTTIFPLASPATISLNSALPNIIADNVTIDGSNAGVILDGSGIGTTPATLLLDDVSLALDGGPNLLSNGDFGAGLGHWRPWDVRPGATRGINTGDFRSAPNAYEWNTVAHAGGGSTVYDTTDSSDPFDDGPYDVGSTVWISATGGSTAELRFWYRYGWPGARLRALFPDGSREQIGTWWFNGQSDWTEAVIAETIPADAVAIALEFKFSHWQSGTTGLVIDGAGHVVIKGLQIQGFPYNGIELRNGASHNLIGGNNSTPSGNCTGECNLISGNGEHGVQISDSGTMSNTISGNYIGTDASGTQANGNYRNGVNIEEGASFNLIGGDTPGERNLISGNVTEEGIVIGGDGTSYNRVSGNYIGTNVSGMAALGNGEGGVDIEEGSGSYNVIGGTNASPGGPCSGECNLISGNDDGIQLESNGVMNNTVSGNYIGTNVLGTAAIGNLCNGVMIFSGSHSNTVTGNLISGNGCNGIEIRDGDTTNNRISGNYIGTDVSGTGPLGNNQCGLVIRGGASDNLIGGDTPGRRNLISHNQEFGVEVNGNNSLYNTLQQNSIHTNAQKGIALTDGGNNNLPPPVITDAIQSSGIVSGTACAGCTIEVFSDAGNQGRVYEGNTTASAGGIWTFNKGSALTGPHTTATATDAQGNTSQFSMPFPSLATYLPIIFKNFDFSAIPPAPTLNPISNPDGDGNYSVSWTAVSGATSYTLQEADNSAFSSPTTAYTGSGTSTSITGQAPGTYYYRVQTVKGPYLSSWSNIRSVTVAPPTGPDAGHYTGSSPSVSFDVSAGPQVCNYDISVPFGVATCHIQHSICATIIGNTFTITRADLDAIYTINGAFDTTVHASGNYTVSICGGTWILPPSTGTWSASKQ
jgi:parallel beta-helix repeat protein